MRNLKKALSLALASVMVLGMMVVGTSAKASPDVKGNHNVEAIELVKVLGIMNGDNVGNWNPEQTLTRNELAVIIAKLANLPLNGSHPFTDVPGWANKYVGALYSNGISAGTSATTYGGAQAVRTVDAALMMVRTLGYLNEKNELKDNGGYVLATTKTAQKIGLFDGVKTLVNAPVTRNDIAQMIKNLLNSYIVVCEVKAGAEITGPDMGVHIPATYTYSYALNGDQDPYTLMERNYPTLGRTNTQDAFGRPAVTYTYKGHTTDAVVNAAPAATYTGVVKDLDVLKAIGFQKNTDAIRNFSEVKNGVSATVGDAITEAKFIDGNKDDMNKAGQVVEVYKTSIKDSYKYDVTVVYVESKITTVSKVNKATKDDARSISLTGVAGKTFETNDFAKDDIVVYTVANDKIQTVELAKKVTGKITKIDNTDYYIDGVKYPLAHAGIQNDVAALEIGATVDAYLVNGAIAKAETVKEAAKDFAYVVDIDSKQEFSKYTHFAKLVLADGSQVTVEYKYDKNGNKEYNELADALAKNDVVKYTVKDGVYYISYVKDNNNEANVQSNGKVSVTGKNPANIASGVVANDKTIFVYNEGTEKDPKYVVATGVKNVPNFDSSDAYYFAKDGVAEVVFMTTGSKASTTAEETIFVMTEGGRKVSESIGDKTVSYYEYKAVVKGEVTTVKVDTDKVTVNTGVYKSVKLNDKGIITDATPVTAENNKVLTNVQVTGVASNGAISLANKGYTYGADVQVFKADTSKETLESISITDLEKTDSLKTVIIKDNAVLAIYMVK